MRKLRSLLGALLIAPAVVPPPCPAQAVALPLQGEGELVAVDTVRGVGRGSVMMESDSRLKVVAVDGNGVEGVLDGAWRMASTGTAELTIVAVLDSVPATGHGEIRFRPDGSVDHIAARGRTADGEFTFRYDNGTDVGLGFEPQPEWDAGPAVVDVVRHGEGMLVESGGREIRLDRARLTLGENDEFRLSVEGDARFEFTGYWGGDPRDNPVRLEVREALGERSGGMGRVWLRERSWDRDWSLQRVELDGWSDDHGDTFRLHFEAGPGSAEP